MQLLESSLAGLVGALALYGVTISGASAGGLIFVAGIAAYTAGRQVLFPLRGIPRTATLWAQGHDGLRFARGTGRHHGAVAALNPTQENGGLRDYRAGAPP